MALTKKGLNTLKYIKEYCSDQPFSAKDLSNACGEKIVAATLNAVAGQGYLIKLGGTPVQYKAVDNFIELLDKTPDTVSRCDNSNLLLAKKAKNDEFYTRYEDIEQEIINYKDSFKEKIIYLPCDDLMSAFWAFFINYFTTFGLKKLIATHYNPDGEAYKVWTNDGITIQKESISNGDFRSSECIDVLKECDIIITNPPFSLFKEFLSLILSYGKQFLIIGPLNALTYKEIFPFVLEEQIWSGYNNVRHFKTPDGKGRTMGNTFWYTNLPNKSLTEELVLTKTYSPDDYPKFDNFDAINVDSVTNIPADYPGLMGVPTSFFQGKYNPNQFQIVGEIKHGSDGEFDFCKPLVNGKEKYTRLVIKNKKL